MLNCRWHLRLAACVAMFMQLAVMHAQKTVGDSVAGTVVSDADGHPLARARLTLTNTKTEEVAAQTAADDEGHFRFEPVMAGKYRLSGTAAHFLPTTYMQHDVYSTALVTGAGLPTDTLVLRLIPAASISGHVVDESDEPVANASVVLYREDLTAPQTVRQVRGAQTEDTGEYELTGLTPGRYYLSVTGEPWYAAHLPAPVDEAKSAYRAASDPALDVAYPMVFYPDAPDSDHATALEVSAGEQMTADMHLIAEHALTVTLKQPPGLEQVQRNPQLARSVFGVEEPLNTQSESADGTWRFAGVAPGRYDLEDFTGGRNFSARTVPLDLTSGPVNMEMPKPAELATVTVTAHVAGGGPVPAGLQIVLHPVSINRNLNVAISDKGVATFTNVPPGDYRFIAGNNERLMGVIGVSVEGKRVADKRLVVTHSVSVDLDISATQVDVEGFVKRAGVAGAASMVVLVPVGADTSAELFRRDQSDLDGSFLLRNVVPGNYIVVAIDDGWPLRWTDITAMTPYLMRGLPVSISASSPADSASSPAAFHPGQAVIAQPK